MTIIVSCDANEAYKATMAAAQIDGPVYLRFERIPTQVVTQESDPIVVVKGNVLEEGNDVVLVARIEDTIEVKKMSLHNR